MKGYCSLNSHSARCTVLLDRHRHLCVRMHIVDLLAIYASSTLLLSGVSRRVLVDGESFVDAVFAVAGQG